MHCSEEDTNYRFTQCVTWWFPKVFPGHRHNKSVPAAIASNPGSLLCFSIGGKHAVARGMESRNTNIAILSQYLATLLDNSSGIQTAFSRDSFKTRGRWWHTMRFSTELKDHTTEDPRNCTLMKALACHVASILCWKSQLGSWGMHFQTSIWETSSAGHSRFCRRCSSVNESI